MECNNVLTISINKSKIYLLWRSLRGAIGLMVADGSGFADYYLKGSREPI
jgi:hypothetical protein